MNGLSSNLITASTSTFQNVRSKVPYYLIARVENPNGTDKVYYDGASFLAHYSELNPEKKLTFFIKKCFHILNGQKQVVTTPTLLEGIREVPSYFNDQRILSALNTNLDDNTLGKCQVVAVRCLAEHHESDEELVNWLSPARDLITEEPYKSQAEELWKKYSKL